jgi:hypothetical protein
MANIRALSLALCLGVAAVQAASPASAQLSTRCLTKGFDESEFDAFHSALQVLLSENAVGASRTWHSRSGKSGRVHLVSGGTKAGSTGGRVRITRYNGKREVDIFTFNYRNVPKKGWQSCG